MTRRKLLLVWLLVMLVSPVMLFAMLCQALLGSRDRALSMALAQDACGNALFGGLPTMTISTRTGNALLAGRRWAKIVAPVIDWIFGAGHCLASASHSPAA